MLLALAACAGGVALGQWQWGRAEERRLLAARVEAAQRAAVLELSARPVAAPELVLRRVAVRGEFEPRYTVLLEYRLHRGRPGFHVVQALRIAGSQRYVAVLRGWTEARARREDLPPIPTPHGEQRIEGLALDHLPQFVEPGREGPECPPAGPAPCLWLNFTPERFAAWSGLALQPVILEQHSELGDGLLRDWARPEAAWRKNEAYALQWYSLAALAVILLVVLSFRRDGAAPG